MRKAIIIVLCITMAAVICLGGCAQKTAYPDELKRVDSVADVEKELAGFEDLCVFDLSRIGATDMEYLVRMSNESASAEAEGYEIVGYRDTGSTTVKYRLVCKGEIMEYISADEMPYRGVPLEVSYKQQTEDSTKQGWCLTFPLKGYSFYLWATYDVGNLDYEQMDETYTATYYDLVDIAEAIIDFALD